MPIYAYKCAHCGFAQDVLQKLSDPQLTECPACHQASFQKQVTAAGFQLKGSGWYVTDFRNGGTPAKPAVEPAAGTDGKPADPAKPAAGTEAASTKSAEPASAPSATPAASPPATPST
jgi:putative FmdB family regulatory protein